MKILTPPDNDWRWFIHVTRLYAAMVYNRVHFAEASYGDGEWYCILGYEGATSNGQVYEPWLGEMLRSTLLEPVGQWFSYFGDPARNPLRVESDQWLKDNGVDVVWFARRPLPAANCHGLLGPFFEAVRTRRTILVGPRHLERLPPEVIGNFKHIPVTDNRAYEEIDETCDRVLDIVRHDDLVCFSSGLASGVSIHRLWPELQGQVTLWDVGAIWDPYCGVYSRKNYAKKEWQRDVMPRNLL